MTITICILSALGTAILVVALKNVIAVNRELAPSEEAIMLQEAIEERDVLSNAANDNFNESEPGAIESKLIAAGIECGKSTWLAFKYGCCALTFVIGLIVTNRSGTTAIFPALFLTLLTAMIFELYLKARTDKNSKLLEKQISQLELQIAENSRSGLSVTRSIAVCKEQAEEPLKRHITKLYNEITYGGLTLSQGFKNMERRCGNADIHLLSVAIAIHEQTGSSLADALTYLHEGISMRLRIRSQLRSQLAETKITRNIVAVAPWALFIALSFFPVIKMDYFWPFYSSNPIGWGILCICILIEVAMLALMGKMSNIRLD